MSSLLTGLVLALTLLQNTDRTYFAYDHETITVANSALPFTASKIASTSNPTNTAELATFTLNCSSGTDCVLRFTLDGTAPTASAGLRLTYGQTMSVYGKENISNFKGIREGATSCLIDVQYFR